MEKWELTIRRVENGYILFRPEEKETVLEFTENVEDDLEVHQFLLYEVLECFGAMGSKHDKRRICVEIKNQNA